jgi:monofunctional biosynthetic peptidoglycan transglycosylase
MMARNKRKRKRRSLQPALRWTGIALLLVLLLSWLPVLLLRWLEPPVTAFMLQHSGSGSSQYAYQWADWPQLGAAAPLAVMAAEDQRFIIHNGFDLAEIRTALVDRLDGRALRGASTISQQVAKNLFLWPGRSLIRKGIEAWFTLLIELTWSKQRILEVYLNIAEFGPGVYGVPAASQLYFGKTASRLNLHEAALLAAVLPNPTQLRVQQPSDYVRQRQHWIVQHGQKLREQGWLQRLN